MPAKYSPVKVFDAKLVYDTWLRLVQDEELYDAMLDGRHADVAKQRGMGSEEILILDDFRSQPGTKWHVDNLRFRCTTMVSRILKWHMPATVMMLTGGNDDWLRDLAYEYMSDHRWKDLGHHRRFAECARFAKVVRTKVMKRRRPPEYFDDVLRYELSVLDLYGQAAALPPDAWTKAGGAGKPRRGAAVQLIELPADLVGWLNKPEGPLAVSSAEPTTALVWIPGPSVGHRAAALDGKARALFEACRGERTVQELAGGSAEAEATLRRWLDEGALAV